MTERKGQPSRNSKNNDEKDDEKRESAENTPNAIPTRGSSEHKSAQTDTTEVRHVGIQFESHPPRDEEETQRKTYNQNLQSEMNNLSVAENQSAAGFPVFKNEGPTQLGKAGTRLPSVSLTHDTVSIIDSKCQVLEPGDVLWTEGPGFPTRAIYVGQQMLVRCDWRTDNQMVKKEELCMTAPFWKCTVISGECSVYPPGERVERATAKIGQRYLEGDRREDGSDFPQWVYTGMGWKEGWEEGFRLVW